MRNSCFWSEGQNNLTYRVVFFSTGKPAESQIEYTSLINIRPHDNNYSMEIEDDVIRKSVENLVKLYLEHDEDGLA